MDEHAPWRITIALEPEEVGPLEAALFAVLTRDRWGLQMPRAEEDRSPALLIDVRAGSRADADAQAEQIYAEARTRAGLPPAPPLVIGARTPLFTDAPHDRLLQEAEVLLEEGRFELAVVRAQTACEMYARLALDQLAEDLPEGDGRGSSLFRGATLMDRRDRALLRSLTHMTIGAQEWWTAYRTHVERRHEIVHQDLSVSKSEALASLGAARSFIAFLQEGWATRALGRPPSSSPPQAL